MSGCTESARTTSWYVILPPPVELGPCLTNAYLSKRSSLNSVVSTASICKDIVESPTLLLESIVERERLDAINVVTMSDRNRPQNGINDDVNGSYDPPDYADSGLESSAINSGVDISGGITREQFPEEEMTQDEDEHQLRTDASAPPSHFERDDEGGLQVEERVRDENMVEDAIAEVSAQSVSRHFSVSLSQHSMEATSSSELRPPDTQPTEIRPETIISPLQSEVESVSGQSIQFDEVPQSETVRKDLQFDRTSESQIPIKMGSLEGFESQQPTMQTLQNLSEHTMDDTTQATLSDHPMEDTTQPILSQDPMEDTTQPTLSQHPIEGDTQDTFELSQYLVDSRSSLDQDSREEPVGQRRLVDSNENILGTESESYASSHSNENILGTESESCASSRSGEASTVVTRRHVEGESSIAKANTTHSLSRPSSSASSVRSSVMGGSGSADESRQRSQENSMSDRGKSGEKPVDAKRKISDATTTSVTSGLTDSRRESGAGDMSEDSIGPRGSSDQSIKLRGSQVALPLDLSTLDSIPSEKTSKDIVHTSVDGRRNGSVRRKQKISHVLRSDSGSEGRGPADQPSGDAASRSYIQYPPSLQSGTPSDISRNDVPSRSSTASHSRDSSRQVDPGGLHGHEDDRIGLLRKVSPEGAEAGEEDSRSQMSSLSSSIPSLPPGARNIPPLGGATNQASNTRTYLNLEDLQTQDALADRVALLLGDAIVTSLSRDRPGVGDGGSSSEAGTPDSIETEKSERRTPVPRDTRRDEHGLPQRQLVSQDPPSTSRSATSAGSFVDSLADRVAQILAESNAMQQIQAYQTSTGGRASPTLSEVSTSSSVRQIIDKVLQKTATGMGYVSGDDTSSICSDIPPFQSGRSGYDYDPRQTMSPRHNLSKSMSVPLGSPYSPESARRSPSPAPYRDDNLQYSPRPSTQRSFGSYQTTDTLDHHVQNLLTHTAYMEQPVVPPAYSPGRESPRSFHGRQSPVASPRLTTFNRMRQGESPVRRHSATGIPRPAQQPGAVPYRQPITVDTTGGGGDQGFYLRMEPEGRSSMGKRPGQPASHIPVPAAAAGRTSPYRHPPDRRSTELPQTYEAQSPRGQHPEIAQSPRGFYVDSPESIDSLAHRVRAILAADQQGDRGNQLLQQDHTVDIALQEGSLQAAWLAKQQASSSARASVQSTPYSSRRESPRASQSSTPRTGSPRGFAPSMDVEDDVRIQEYGAFDRARHLISNQMQRVTDMTFDHSVDIRDPFTNRIIGRTQPRRSNAQDQYGQTQSSVLSPRAISQISSSPRASPLLSPRMNPQSGYHREAWGEDYEQRQQEDFKPMYYGSLPDNVSPGLPDERDSQHFFPVKPHPSPTRAFQPVPIQHYGSLPRSLHKSKRDQQAAADISSMSFGPLPRSVSNPDIDVDQPPRSPRAYTRQMSERYHQQGEPLGPDDIKYKTWESDIRAAQARMSPRTDRAASLPVVIPSSPQMYRRSMSSRDSDRMSPRSFTRQMQLLDHQYGSMPSKVVSPLGRDTYGASTIRAYRPPGSSEVQYTYPVTQDESSAASHQTTMESSHLGSDDAHPPAFPPGTLGSRRDAPPLLSPHAQSRVPSYNRATSPVDQTTGRNRGASDPGRGVPARSYVEYPSDLRSDDTSGAGGLHVESQHQYRASVDDRYQERLADNQGAAAMPTTHISDMPQRTQYDSGPAMPTASSAHISDMPQRIQYGSGPVRTSGDQGAAIDPMPPTSDRPLSPRTQYRSESTRQDTRTSDLEYARMPHSPDARIVRDLPPLHPSARSGHRRAASDSGVRHERFTQQSSDVPRPPGNYSRRVLQDVIQNESDPRYAEIGQAWEEYERFRADGSTQSSLDSERIRQVTDLLEDPVKHQVTRWTKLDEDDTKSESSYDSRTRRRKRWEEEQPFSPAQLNNTYDREKVAVAKQQSGDQSTSLDSALIRQSSITSEEEYPQERRKQTKKPETREHHQKTDSKPWYQKDSESKQAQEDLFPNRDESATEDTSLTSVDTLLSDLSLESDQLYRLLGAQGVRKLSSKLAKLQNKIDRQKEHQRKREEQKAKHAAPKMASTPAQQAPSNGDSTIHKVADVIKSSKSNGFLPPVHMLSPVAERSHEIIDLPLHITSDSVLSEQEPIEKPPVKRHRKYVLTDRQLKKLERRRRHKHINYKDDFQVSYGSEGQNDSLVQSDSLSEGSVPCTCRPRKTKSLQDIAGKKARSKAVVTIEPKSHTIRKGAARAKMSQKASRLPTRIPVDDLQTRDAATNYPSPAQRGTDDQRRAARGTAFTITFPASDKKKGKNGNQPEEDAEENERRRKPLHYRHRGLADGEGSGSGKPEPVAWFQPFNKKMPWQQQDTQARKPLADTQPSADTLQPPGLKREGTKTMVKLSLQEALEEKRAEFISRSRERQKRLQLAAEERQAEIQYELERNKLFQDKRPPKANTQAHPYSDQLHKPKKRNLTKKEIKEQTQKLYAQLPEVLKKAEAEKRIRTYESNRMKGQVYKKKIHERTKGKPWSES